MKSSREIEEICRKYNIKNYTINDDGYIDVDGGVNLFDSNLTYIPLNFNKVEGTFNCGFNNLTSLKGSPKTVTKGGFYCQNNKLTSLEFGPIEVVGGFHCNVNKLTSLEFSPIKVIGEFSCNNNELTSLEYSPKEIIGDFSCYNNPKLTNLYGISDNINGLLHCDDTPVGSIINKPVNMDFVRAFNSYRVIKDDKVVLKRLKYVMELFDMSYDLEKIKEYYEII